MDEMGLCWLPKQQKITDCCVHIFTEICLQHNIPDQAAVYIKFKIDIYWENVLKYSTSGGLQSRDQQEHVNSNTCFSLSSYFKMN